MTETSAPILYRCPSCGRVWRLPNHLVGKRVKCSKCGNTVPLDARVDTPTAANSGVRVVALCFCFAGTILFSGLAVIAALGLAMNLAAHYGDGTGGFVFFFVIASCLPITTVVLATVLWRSEKSSSTAAIATVLWAIQLAVAISADALSLFWIVQSLSG
jgi:uncharacterized paraquat-inducible protein A